MGLPFVPDIEYKIQLQWLLVAAAIVYSALFVDKDYLEPLPQDQSARDTIEVSDLNFRSGTSSEASTAVCSFWFPTRT
jgi:hypothetical protein